MPASLGKLESQLLAYAQLRKKSVFRTPDVAVVLSLSTKQASELLSRLCRKKIIAQVNRGLYLVPQQLPPGGIWTPSEYLALETLMDDLKATYQITGQAAFQRYGWDEQIPSRLDVYNNQASGTRRIGSTEFRLIKVDESRLGDADKSKLPNGEIALYSSKPRALLDAVYDWKKFGSLPAAFDWIRIEIQDAKFASRFVRSVIRFGNMGTIRRVGKLLEMENTSPELLRKLEKTISKSSATIPWNPVKPKKGSTDSKWGVILNDQV